MDRSRFEHLLEAYGGDFARWPANERAAAAAFVAQHGEEVAQALRAARALDAALKAAREAAPDTSRLARRVLARAPGPQRQGFGGRAKWALAACAVFGALLGYGGGLMAPATAADDSYFLMAFEAPFEVLGDDR